jgi:hypothetical protein
MEPCCDTPDVVSAADDYEIVFACRSCGTFEPSLVLPVDAAEDGARLERTTKRLKTCYLRSTAAV